MARNYLTYEEFGAKGDGVHDDFPSIIACHEEANIRNLPVRARDGASYYISGSNKTAIIKTDVDFSKAKFIIDDRNVESRESYVFTVLSDHEPIELKLNPIKHTDSKVDIGLAGNYYVKIKNQNKKIYIRKGLNMNNGTSTVDAFIVNKNGEVFPSINWDYPEVTYAYARCTDDSPITVKGGHFVTVANEEESFYRYYQRGFLVNRSHVLFTDVYHTVDNEGEHGAPYHGFIRVNDSYDVTIKDCLLTPRFIYKTESQIPGQTVSMGSYDLSFWCSIDVRCLNVKQTIDIKDAKYWGIYTSNFCKNLILEDCIISRFDAHQGVTNATIRRCTLGHQGVQLIGHGDFILEDTTLYSRTDMIYLRCDYGSLWDGNITVKNCDWYTQNVKLAIIGGNNVGDHDYGYLCRFGKNITLDGIRVHAPNLGSEQDHYLFLIKNGSFDPKMPFAEFSPEKLLYRGIVVDNGTKVQI